jgi:hypothetical protein
MGFWIVACTNDLLKSIGYLRLLIEKTFLMADSHPLEFLKHQFQPGIGHVDGSGSLFSGLIRGKTGEAPVTAVCFFSGQGRDFTAEKYLG